MPGSRFSLSNLAITAGILTIVTSVLFARMPDPFVSQFGWFIVLLGPLGGCMLIGTARWYRSGREPRTATLVMAALAIGDFLFNAAALRAASLGVIPSPNALHGLTAAACVVLAVCGLWSSYFSSEPPRPRVLWASAFMLAGMAIGGAVAFEGMVLRALEPHRAAVEACNPVVTSLEGFEFTPCIAREEAKPLSTRGFLFGVGGFGAMALGAGALAGALRHPPGPAGSARSSTLHPAIAVAALLAIGSLVVAASAGVADLNRMHQGCRPGEPRQQSRAKVISVEEQAFRDCVVARGGVNPWGVTFWSAFAIGVPALVASGSMFAARTSGREAEPPDSA